MNAAVTRPPATMRLLPAAHPHPAVSEQPAPYRPRPFDEVRRRARYDANLPAFARLFFDDVCELAERRGYCWADDEHFAEKFGVSDRAVRKWITALIDAGYLRKRQQAGRRILTPVTDTDSQPDTRDEGAEIEPDSPVWNDGSVDWNGRSGEWNNGSANSGTTVPTPRDNTPPLGGESGARARTREDGQADTEGSSASLPLTSRQEASRNEGGSARRDDSPLVVDGPHAGLVQPEDAPAVAVYVSRTGRRPTPLQGGEIATAVGEAPDRLATFAAVCEIWMGAGYQTANHRRLLRHFEEEMAGGTVASRPHERQGTPPRRQDSGTYADARAHVERLTEFK